MSFDISYIWSLFHLLSSNSPDHVAALCLQDPPRWKSGSSLISDVVIDRGIAERDLRVMMVQCAPLLWDMPMSWSGDVGKGAVLLGYS